MLTIEKITALKDKQLLRLQETKELYIEPWDEIIEIKKLTLDDMIKSEQAAYEVSDNGERKYSEDIRKAVLVLLGVVGLHILRDKDFIMGEPAGVINDICKEIVEFSGFGTSVEKTIEQKKKL